MQYKIRNLDPNKDWQGISHVFNYYIQNDVSAYPEEIIDDQMFEQKYTSAPDYPFFVIESRTKIVGFGYLFPFRQIKTMKHTATLTYFIMPEFTNKGIGSELLINLLNAGEKMGVKNFLAHISSLNKGSIRFHQKHGFKECGLFQKVGIKFGKSFDMVWMQLIRE